VQVTGLPRPRKSQRLKPVAPFTGMMLKTTATRLFTGKAALRF
jgi:hypothetical protein